MDQSSDEATLLSAYLRDRRHRLDPAALGFAVGRRRTPGLRREEVAQRANISPTWYTWLEQGRGGAPSAEVLNRIAGALLLTEAEREHLFVLGLGRLPEVRYQAAQGVTPHLQRLLDALEVCPALVKTATWDIVAWNRAAEVVLTDYTKLPPGQRNILRQIFTNPQVRAEQHDWPGIARFVVGAFRADATRSGALSEVSKLVEELCQVSPEFAELWRENDVGLHGDGVKQLNHPKLGTISLEHSGLSIDGRPDLSLVIYNPATPEDARRIRSIL